MPVMNTDKETLQGEIYGWRKHGKHQSNHGSEVPDEADGRSLPASLFSASPKSRASAGGRTSGSVRLTPLSCSSRLDGSISESGVKYISPDSLACRQDASRRRMEACEQRHNLRRWRLLRWAYLLQERRSMGTKILLVFPRPLPQPRRRRRASTSITPAWMSC